MSFSEHTILSRPIRLAWAGWETDTLRLQQCGWSLAAEQSPMNGKMRLMMKHDHMRMQAMTDLIDFDYYAARTQFNGDYIRNLVVPVQALGGHITVHQNSYVPALNWGKPIDAYPQFASVHVASFEDLVHFAPSLARTQELILPPETVPDLLKRIVEMQDPDRQARLKAELREGSTKQRQVFHAQILSLVAA